jgi:metal-responsive CopG/Arc/MetJ family transcriptional regulator
VQKISFRIPDEVIEDIEAYEDEKDLSRSEACRELISSALEDERGQSADDRLRSVREQYEDQIDDLERDIERLNRERRQILEQREEHDELVRAVEREQSLAERKAEAGLGTRLKWWAFGMSDE